MPGDFLSSNEDMDGTPAPGRPGAGASINEHLADLGNSGCMDRIRYRVVSKNGRFIFKTIEIIGDDSCSGDFAKALKEKVEGRSIDEIDLDELESHECARGSEKSCQQALADVIRDLKDILPGAGIAKDDAR